ncbi:MAG TPA: V-type ATP synthase subunit D [Desulfobulbus sp.]|nr:V-type ATP synthase subunit D [Desulfobulbus sp.]
MEKLQIPATKSNLLRLREELALALDGLDLLDQKKEILIGQVNLLASRADHVRGKVNRGLAHCYAHLDEALLDEGRASVAAAGLAPRAGEEIRIRERSLMGVILPLVDIRLRSQRPGYTLFGTSSAMDATATAVNQVLEPLAELAELEVGIKRLLAELKKTLKRINALEHIYIPSYRVTVKAMEETLEEKEREALFQMKRMRRRQVSKT